jgi:alanine transaminase
VVNASYAVRGELVQRADKFREQLQHGETKLPFKRIIACNIGNPHELGQSPITYFRQVLSLLQYPALLQNPKLVELGLYAPDAIERAKHYLAGISGGTGAYTTSQGLKVVRQQVAAYIEKRDGGIKADPDNVSAHRMTHTAERRRAKQHECMHVV